MPRRNLFPSRFNGATAPNSTAQGFAFNHWSTWQAIFSTSLTQPAHAHLINGRDCTGRNPGRDSQIEACGTAPDCILDATVMLARNGPGVDGAVCGAGDRAVNPDQR